MMQRREFLRTAGVVVVSTLAFGAAARTQTPGLKPVGSSLRRAFPWGVASADPQPDAVMVWTKLVPRSPRLDEQLVLQLSLSRDFSRIELQREIRAKAADDHTVRVLISPLDPDTTYFYRFIATDGAVSRTGRTWTAPSPDATRAVLIAVASCQSYPASQYGSYRHLIARERRTGERPDFILHLGDYVYGSDKRLPLDPATGLSGPEPASSNPGTRPQSSERQTPAASADKAVPTGRRGRAADPAAGIYDYDAAVAATRELYSKYHLDRDLQDARALYPFVTIWDDHEFGNDVWQSFSGDGSNPVGRMAATQVWSEWVPQILDENRSIPNVRNEAAGFRRRPVRGEELAEFDGAFLARNPQNLTAIQAMTSYRALRWGKMVDLIITDNRSYRGPGANPAILLDPVRRAEESAGASNGFALYEADVLHVLAEGRFANGGNPPATIRVNGHSVPNPRRDAPRVSLLGSKQKDWFKRCLSQSGARWKVWANAQPITGFRWDLDKIAPRLGSGFSWLDSWDGFPNERRELLQYIRQNRIANVVSLAGDRHAQFAACAADDYALENPDHVIPEFTCTGISAFPRAANLGRAFERLGIGDYAWASIAGKAAPACTLDATLTMGAEATKALLRGTDRKSVEQLAKHGPNPQLVHSDLNSHGYMLARFTLDAVQVEFVTLPPVAWDPARQPDGPEARRITRFETPAWAPTSNPAINLLSQTGEPTLGRLG